MRVQVHLLVGVRSPEAEVPCDGAYSERLLADDALQVSMKGVHLRLQVGRPSRGSRLPQLAQPVFESSNVLL